MNKHQNKNSVRVDVNASVLRWALKRSRNVSRIEKRFPKLSEWLNGETKPTLRQLEDFARATYVPLGYLFLSEPPTETLPLPYFRTIKDHVVDDLSPNLIETVQTMRYRQAWMRDYLIEQGQEPLPFVGSVRVGDNEQVIVEGIRNTLGLRKEWAGNQRTWTDALRYLMKKIEDVGIIVVVNGVVGNNTKRKLDPAEFRGFVLVDEYAPLIFLNGTDGKAAQMFTLAHELAHIWFGFSAIFDLHNLLPADEEIERVCNKVAAEFLVPKEEISAIWSKISQETNRFQTLARHFKVSELVAARRVLDLDFITKDEFFNFYNDYAIKERSSKKQSNGGDFYANQNFRVGRYFAEATIRAAREGKLLYHEAYKLTGLYGDTFERYAESLGLGESL